MSARQEVAALVSESGGNTSVENKYHVLIKSAVNEIMNLLEATRDSLGAICKDVEAAASRDELKKAFKMNSNCLFHLQYFLNENKRYKNEESLSSISK